MMPIKSGHASDAGRYTAGMRFLFAPAFFSALALGLTQAAHAAPSGSSPQTRQAAPSSAPVAKTRQHTGREHPAHPAAAAQAYAGRSDVQQWVDDAAARLDLPPAWLREQIGQARRISQIEKLILPAASPSAKNWAAYRNRFIEARRIEAGAAFWQRHQTTLTRAEQIYGVPISIIVGIIGVETLYGQHMGSFRILDALATLTFDFPQSHPRARERQAFFQGELEHFLRLAKRSGTDPKSWRGSYAGAMGLPQFMPSSWSRYAVDFDGDGRIDLFNSPADAIGSVAHYFRAFQWKPGMPTHYPVTLPPGQTDMDALLAPDILPTFSVDSFAAKGARLEGPALQHSGPLALIELRNGEAAPSYVAGTENFYAITRYNWSSYYAMAVIELGQAVAERMNSSR